MHVTQSMIEDARHDISRYWGGYRAFMCDTILWRPYNSRVKVYMCYWCREHAPACTCHTRGED
jgi:hypothetical protein